jgi:hypothetical protein
MKKIAAEVARGMQPSSLPTGKKLEDPSPTMHVVGQKLDMGQRESTPTRIGVIEPVIVIAAPESKATPTWAADTPRWLIEEGLYGERAKQPAPPAHHEGDPPR